MGAYQEALSSDHNLFGRPAEVTVETDAAGAPAILDARESDTCADMLARWGYEELAREHASTELHAVPDPAQADAPSARLERLMAQVLGGGTYLDRDARAAGQVAAGQADTALGRARLPVVSEPKRARSATGS